MLKDYFDALKAHVFTALQKPCQMSAGYVAAIDRRNAQQLGFIEPSEDCAARQSLFDTWLDNSDMSQILYVNPATRDSYDPINVFAQPVYKDQSCSDGVCGIIWKPMKSTAKTA